MIKSKRKRPPRQTEELIAVDMMKWVSRDKLTKFIDESAFCFLVEAAFIQQGFHDSVKVAVRKGVDVKIPEAQARRMISICLAIGPYATLLNKEYPLFPGVIDFIKNNYNKIVAHMLLEGMEISMVKV